MTSPLLEVEDLTVRFTTRDGQVTVLDEVSFTLQPGERISFVGESCLLYTSPSPRDIS